MDEKDKQDAEDAVIKAIREEYEKKLDEQRKELSEEKERALAEQEEKHIRQMRALLSGRQDVKDEQVDEEKNYEQALTDSLKKRFKLN